MKANVKGKALLEKMMANKQLRIREARLEYAQEILATDGNKPASAIPAHDATERV